MKTLRLIVSVIATLTSIVANAKGARDGSLITFGTTKQGTGA